MNHSIYAWIITKDYTQDPSTVNVQGPSNATEQMLQAVAVAGQRFRLLDGDDQVTLEGRVLLAPGAAISDAVNADFDNDWAWDAEKETA